MDTVYFTTLGPLDMRAVTTMGISVKVNASPIGYFGTGLKYAIAVLLRNKQQIEIQTSGTTYKFGTVDADVRGAKFQIVTMNGQELGFTTELGKNWKLWQAFRELESNTRDEGGRSGLEEPKSVLSQTVIKVTGEEFVKEYHNRGATFLDSEPIAVLDNVMEIHAGPSNRVFYRGVRVLELEKPAKFAYNIICPVELTEDRTIKHHYEFQWHIMHALAEVDNLGFLRNMVQVGDEDYEGKLMFSGSHYKPTPKVLETLNTLKNDHSIKFNREVLGYLFKYRPHDEIFQKIEATEEELMMIQKAITFLQKLDVAPQAYKIYVAERLERDVLGTALNGQIWLSKRAFKMGQKQLIQTMFEEYVHVHYGYSDTTRQLQDFLFETIVGLGEQITGDKF